MMVRWWWFGPGHRKPELEREMRSMKDAGIGGVRGPPVYPPRSTTRIEASATWPYLSPEFLDALQITSGKARELGLRADLTLGSDGLTAGSADPPRLGGGSGWPFRTG